LRDGLDRGRRESDGTPGSCIAADSSFIVVCTDAFAGNADDETAGIGDPRADCSRKTEAHRAGCDPAIGAIKTEDLRHPHLLISLGGDDRGDGAIKKGPVRDLVFGAWAAVAGRLHRPAHAPYHHYENRCYCHEW
jgi:hypothetical protein